MTRISVSLSIAFFLAAACGDTTPDERARAQKDRGKAMITPSQEDEQHEQPPQSEHHKKRRLMRFYQ